MGGGEFRLFIGMLESSGDVNGTRCSHTQGALAE